MREPSPAARKNAPRLSPRPGILKIAPYVGGDSELPGITQPIKLASNESALGPSPRVVKAFQDCAGKLHRYPDGSHKTLREAIARRYGLDAANIVCGNGSDERTSTGCAARTRWTAARRTSWSSSRRTRE